MAKCDVAGAGAPGGADATLHPSDQESGGRGQPRAQPRPPQADTPGDGEGGYGQRSV